MRKNSSTKNKKIRKNGMRKSKKNNRKLKIYKKKTDGQDKAKKSNHKAGKQDDKTCADDLTACNTCEKVSNCFGSGFALCFSVSACVRTVKPHLMR